MHTLLTKVKLCSRFSASASKVQYYGDHSRVSVGHQSADPATRSTKSRTTLTTRIKSSTMQPPTEIPTSFKLKPMQRVTDTDRHAAMEIDAVVANTTFNTLTSPPT